MKTRKRRLRTSELVDLLELQKMQLVIALDGEPLDNDRVFELCRKIRETRQAISDRLHKKEKKR